MKIIAWNVNCAVGSDNGRQEIMTLFEEKPDCDILILTEFYRLKDYEMFEKRVKDWGYELYISTEQNKRNDVVIAVQEQYKPQLQENDKKCDFTPDYLAVSLSIDGKNFAVIGVRFFGGYNEMNRQFLNFLPIINGFENAIIGGDFNNGKIHGDENATYSERQIDCLYVDSANGYSIKYEHFDYNYHRLKFWFALNKYTLVTPPNGVSYKYKKPYYGGSKIDHFAVKGIQICNTEYRPTSLSDHNQLFGEILL